MTDIGDRLAALPSGSRRWICLAVEDMMGMPAIGISMPGGKGRDSARVTLDDGRTVIATLRSTRRRTQTEALLLGILAAGGAPAPRPLGFRHGLLVQTDAGRRPVSVAMQEADAAERRRLALAAMDALDRCRAAIAARPRILAGMPGLAMSETWLDGYCARPFHLSAELGIAAPDVAPAVLRAAIAARPRRFTRWDARLANTAVQPDGSVVWFDWDQHGRRAGVEDLGWAVADDWWRLDPDASDAVLRDAIADPNGRLLARRVGIMVGADRLGKIWKRVRKHGWTDTDRILRRDRMGADPEIVRRTAGRMAAMAASDQLLAGMSDWFEAAGAEILAKGPDVRTSARGSDAAAARPDASRESIAHP